MGIIALLFWHYHDRRAGRRERVWHANIYGVLQALPAQQCLAKIWIECNGMKDISVAYNNGIPEKKMRRIMDFIDEHYDEINEQIDKTFAGEKTRIIISK